jgi:hypothetical protein
MIRSNISTIKFPLMLPVIRNYAELVIKKINGKG